MYKIFAALALAFGLTLTAVPAVADTPAPAPRLTVEEIPHCYTVGLVTGIDNVCTDAVTCDRGDVTCSWFCDNAYVTVECAYTDDSGVRTWANILYDLIDHYRSALAQRTTEAQRQAEKIHRQARTIARLHRKLHRLRHHSL